MGGIWEGIYVAVHRIGSNYGVMSASVLPSFML